MSLESAKEFMAKFQKDQELAAKLTATMNPAEKMAVAKAAGYDFPLEELAKVNEELSEAELDAVVGGEWNPNCSDDGHCGETCEADCASDGKLRGGRDSG